jgi:hypothetical protein
VSLTTWKKTSAIIGSLFPDSVRDDNPMFVAFLAAYHQWLEQTGNANYNIVNFQSLLDVDSATSPVIDRFHREFLSQIPQTALADRALLIKHIRQFYRAKGTEQAARFLFRIMYGQEIGFYYPKVDVFRPSDSQWSRRQSLIMTPYAGYDIADAVHGTLTGNTSGATTTVESVVSYVDANGAFVGEAFYSRKTGTFLPNEYVKLANTTIGMIVPGGVKQHPGVYISFEGHASRSAKLQDSFFYQDFSYVIQSRTSFNDYFPVFQELVHPAGTKVFGQYLIDIVADVTQPTVAVDRVDFAVEPDAINQTPTIYSANSYFQIVNYEVDGFPFANSAYPSTITATVNG